MADLNADVVVLGAGHNSLVAAAYLAKAGLRTVLLEAKTRVGGGCSTEELTAPGFRHDPCAGIHAGIMAGWRNQCASRIRLRVMAGMSSSSF